MHATLPDIVKDVVSLKTIEDLSIGESGLVAPGAMLADRSGLLWLTPYAKIQDDLRAISIAGFVLAQHSSDISTISAADHLSVERRQDGFAVVIQRGASVYRAVWAIGGKEKLGTLAADYDIPVVEIQVVD
jgi:hypothetical protein